MGSLQGPVTQRHISLICDEVGAAWRDLGAELRLGSPVVRNLTFDFNSNRDRAWQVIDKWRQSNPNEATVGNLVDALVKIGMGKAAQKLIGQRRDGVEVQPLYDGKHSYCFQSRVN